MPQSFARFLTLLCSLFLSVNVAAAQQQPKATLSADRIVYTSGYKVLRASGNVIIIYGDSLLEASALTYDEQNDRITADGPIRLKQGDNVTIFASFAELSGDMRNGILKSARMVLNQQLQLTAVEITRSKGRYNELFMAAASTCTVSVAKPTPLWQFRARRIIHDEERKVLFFERAQLLIGNVPVAYIPRLKVPDPSVKRANGFLVPGISNSSKLGFGVYAPYFVTLGKYADVTLTPFVFSSGTASLKFDFRKRFFNGEFNAVGRISNDTVASNTLRAYIFANGKLTFKNGFKGELGLQMVSDPTYLTDHGISSTSRLESFVRLSRTKRASYFGAELLGFRSLAAGITPSQIPSALSDIGFKRHWSDGLFGGRTGLSLNINSYTRSSTIDIVGRDTLRLASVVDWQRQWVGARGLVFGLTAQVNADAYNIRQDSGFSSSITRLAPTLAADFRLPMVKRGKTSLQTLEPRIQIVWSKPGTTPVPNEDSTLVEFDATNLFALNHFSGIDQIEQGLRANIGVSYSRKSENGWNIDATLGKVVRASDPAQFTLASGLSGTSSSYVLGGQVSLPSKFRVIQRAVFDTSFSLSKNETKLVYHGKKIQASSSYLWLVSGAAGNSVDRSEWTFDGGWDLGNNWRTKTSWRYDLAASKPSNAAIALTYRNECIKVALSLSRQFAASSNVGASTNIGLQVSLEGFGSRADSSAYQRKCGDL
ncbi:MAG: LPS-assembly protein LptD [Alphaproteobacteria bacterium]|nr:LPS-assembly protein LptD [Alphaproteobacteria bacterium]